MLEKVAIAIVTSDWFIAAVIAALVRWLAGWLLTTTGLKFKKYEGWAITAVKAAEKLIPDDATNKSIRKLDAALRIFGEKYEAATGVKPSARALVEIENLVTMVHAKLEAGDQL